MTSSELLSRDLQAKLERFRLQTRRPHIGKMLGDRTSPKRGLSPEFADFRPYVHGDDLRQIDWKAYARLERFFLRLFVEEEDLCLHLLIDASTSMDWGEPSKLDVAKKLAAALGYIALAGTEWVQLGFVGGAGRTTGSGGVIRTRGGLPALRGRAAVPQFFDMLLAVQPGGKTDLGAAMRRQNALPAPRGPLLIISDLYDEAWQDALRLAAASGYDATLIHLLSPEELYPDVEGDLKLLDSEGDVSIEISADGETQSVYRERLVAWQTEIQSFCRRRSIPYIPLASDLSVDDFVLNLARRQGVLA